MNPKGLKEEDIKNRMGRNFKHFKKRKCLYIEKDIKNKNVSKKVKKCRMYL